MANPMYQPPQSVGRSHRSRNIVIAIVASILIVSLVFAAVLFVNPNNNNGNQNTPTPSATAVPTPTRSPTATPTMAPTATPTLAPTPTPQPLNSTITAINLQFVYQSTDQGYFGANSQTLSFDNQPNGMLSIYQGQTFWFSFKLTASSNGQSDSIVSITTTTPGFSVISTTPPTPIFYTSGSSITILSNFTSPQGSFDGPVNLVITTSG